MTIYEGVKCAHGEDMGNCHICEAAPDMDSLLYLALQQASEHLSRYGVAHGSTGKVLLNAMAAVRELGQLREVLSNVPSDALLKALSRKPNAAPQGSCGPASKEVSRVAPAAAAPDVVVAGTDRADDGYPGIAHDCETMRGALEQIARYKGEGPMTAPWQDIVRALSDLARHALKNTRQGSAASADESLRSGHAGEGPAPTASVAIGDTDRTTACRDDAPYQHGSLGGAREDTATADDIHCQTTTRKAA